MSSITEYIASLPKPDCAVSINGNWLEDLVHGYRTHSVTGRNAMNISITETEIGNANGSRYRRKRDESKDLTVSFGLVADDETAVHQLSELLQKFLNEENAQFIFYDEQHMYYIGTVSSFTENWINAEGSDFKAMTGEFVIRCSDPYRHATTAAVVETNGKNGTKTVELTNRGTSPVPLYIEAYMWNSGKMLAYSIDKNNSDTLVYILGSATSIETKQTDTAPWTAIDKDLSTDPEWTTNAGILPPIDVSGEQSGTLKFASGGARANSYGDGSYWHGPSLSRIVPHQNGNYPVNWRSDSKFFFNTGKSDSADAYGLQALTFADGAGDPLVSVVQVDATNSDDTEVRCYINRTKYVLGTINKNQISMNDPGSLSIEKIDSDVHVVYSVPKVVETTTNTAGRENKGGADKRKELRHDAASNWHSGVVATYYAWFEETSVDVANNKSTITWAANCVQGGNTLFIGSTRPHAGIINIYINGTCVCSEHVPLVSRKTGEVWASGWRTFTVDHNDDGSKSVEISMDFNPGTDDVGRSIYYWGDGPLVKDTLKLSTLAKTSSSKTTTNVKGTTTLDRHFTIGNPNTSLRQFTWWTAAYGDDYSETKDNDGKVTSTSGYKRFDNSILHSFKLIKYADKKTSAKVNSAYFASGDTISIDADTNTVRQNGINKLNIVDITSEPLLLYPGRHVLKVATDASTPPTLRITYRERWK